MTKQDNSDRKQIRFGHELLELLNKARGKEALGSFVKRACKDLAIKELQESVNSHKVKVCKDCGETKPLSEFNKDSKRPHWSGSKCKSCKAAYDKARYK